MKISIVTISYNQAQFLQSAIESVISQEHDNVEYIVVDAGSSDGSREIIEHYSERIQKIIFEPDKGPADGLNKGFAHATGDVFGYVNADDILLPGALTKVADYFQKIPCVDVLLGNGVMLDARGNITREIFSSEWDSKRYIYGGCNVVQIGQFFRSAIFRAAGGFNIANRTCWDGELLVDMAQHGANFFKIDDFLGGFRVYPGTISSNIGNNVQYRQDLRRIFRKIMLKDFSMLDHLFVYLYRCRKKSFWFLERTFKSLW